MEEIVPRPSVSELYVRHGFIYDQIDAFAMVPPGTTVKMVQDVPVPRAHAERALIAISARALVVYNLGNVHINLEEEKTQLL
jgi:hypothetical protein